jgi:carboxypeptidase Taq
MGNLMPDNMHLTYKRLLEKNKNAIILGSTEAIINWDMQTMMPLKAVNLRSEQLALLSKIHHKMSISPAIGKLLDILLKHPDFEDLSQFERRNVHLIKKNYDEQTKLPTKLVTAIAKQQVLTVNIWKKAKTRKEFALLKPELNRLVSLNEKAAEILMKVKETKTPYDALIDIYEPMTTSKCIETVFAELEKGLRTLLKKIEGSKKTPSNSLLSKNVSQAEQRKIAILLMETLGYEVPPSTTAGGRLDETEHPFTTGYYDDVRITTHYYTNNFASSIFSVLHETGHALYEQGLPQEWKYQPIGAPCSMGIHESQSRLYENIIGRSKEFWTTILPRIKVIPTPSLSKLEIDRFIPAINAVKPSKIRIEADEVTYSLHIVIRFQIENDLFSGKIQVNELPDVWNEKYNRILGVEVKDDSEGVMQDTHWASGLYGYFPTYALGNIYSGQMISKFEKENSEWCNQLLKGDLTLIKKWLADNVYQCGNLLDPEDLMRKITGTAPTVKPFLGYLENKYGKLYSF